MEGVSQVGNFNPYEEVPAATYHSLRNVAVSSRRTLAPLAEGGYVCIKGVDFGGGAKALALTLAGGGKSEGGSIKVCADHFGANGTVLAEIKIGKKSEVEEKISHISGVHDLYFVFNGVGGLELCSWRFIAEINCNREDFNL